MENPLANNVDPDQMPHDVASDLGLHCLPRTLLWVSRIKLFSGFRKLLNALANSADLDGLSLWSRWSSY